MKRDELVVVYFELGFKQKEILFCLAQRHGIILSSRTLKRVLKRYRLYRRNYKTDLLEVVFFIEKELRECGKLHGYRWMHIKCIQNRLVVSQETVRMLYFTPPPKNMLKTTIFSSPSFPRFAPFIYLFKQSAGP